MGDRAEGSIIHPVMILSVRCPTRAPLLFVALAYCMCANANNEASARTIKAPAIPREHRCEDDRGSSALFPAEGAERQS